MASEDLRASVVCPGNHDGAHLGHRALLEASCRRAEGHGRSVVAMTFDPHPAALLAPERAPPLLTTPARRAALLEAFGADRVVIQRFDRAFAALAPERFVDEVLVARLRAEAVVVGPDFRYGRGRAGTVKTLAAHGERAGFTVDVVDPIRLEGAPVSSTRVREALREGDVELASRLLGRVHDVGGLIIEGDRRGRQIGFPTANLDPEPVLLPADGVYAVVAEVEGKLRRGVANLGVRPTFEAGRSLEVHLLDFEGDLYGQSLRVGFVGRIRGERRFDGLEALKAQIRADVDEARGRLAAAEEALWRWI